MLNMKKVELERISDADMYLFFEKVKEKEFLTLIRDIVKLTINIWNLVILNNDHILCSDANNLHGYAKSKFLPTSEFKCIIPKDFESNK